MKKTVSLLIVAALIIAGFFLLQEEKPLSHSPSTEQEASPPESPKPAAKKDASPGDELLKGYGSPNKTAANDMIMLGATIENFLHTVKNIDSFEASTNEQFAQLLKGNNSYKLRFLSDNNPVFNDKGLIVDRWGSPIFFHPIQQGEVEIRSAGPDKKLFTEDDLHRDQTGAFRSPKTITEPSLFPQPLVN